MRYLTTTLAAALALAVPAAGAAGAAMGTTTYEFTLQNERQQATQVLILPTGAGAGSVRMPGGVLEVTPPARPGDPSVIRLFRQGATDAAPLHTARHASPADGIIRVAYTLCGDRLLYQSPTPPDVMGCAELAEREKR